MVQEAQHPRADGGERRHPEHQLDGSVVEPRPHLVLPHLVSHPARFEPVDPDAHFDPVLPLDLPRLVGQGSRHVHVNGHHGVTGVTPGHLPLDAVHPERAHGRPVEVPGHQVPVPEAEPQGHGRNAPRLAAVGEGGDGPGADRLEQLDQRRRGDHGGDGADVAEAGRAQLEQRIPTTRIAEVDAGDGEVERDLLVGLEIQVGQVERVAVDAVPVLLVARQPLGQHRDALVAQQSLVPLEGLTTGRVLGGVAGNLVRDRVERHRLARRRGARARGP